MLKTWLVSQFVPRTIEEIDAAAAEMATDIHRRTVMTVQKDTSALANSGRIERIIAGWYRVVFGSSRVPYARIQHEGGVIKPKNKQFLSWINSQGERVFAKSVTIKGTKYLEKAGDSVSRGNKSKYFRSTR